MLSRTFRAALLALIILSSTVVVCSAKMVSISGEKVNMRSGPGTKYAVLWELGRGYPLMILERKGNWLQVRDFEGDKGWVYGSLVSRKAHLVVKKKIINIRSGPGTNYRIVGRAKYGTVFRTLKRVKGWVKVKHESGLTGWIYRNLLWGW